uniref:Uncharacterized protein n=1 Tax=Moniliophthora roreri TaxID=221103 RepID=A0A0W0FR37_MONRR
MSTDHDPPCPDDTSHEMPDTETDEEVTIGNKRKSKEAGSSNKRRKVHADHSKDEGAAAGSRIKCHGTAAAYAKNPVQIPKQERFDRVSVHKKLGRRRTSDPGEEDKGNAAFKSGDYPTAIGHYSAAIIEDRNDPKFPLNRAAAYLKLGKNEDAESDCTTALTLSPLNVKGIFRRGQAGLGMGKLDGAKGDFEAATKIEPGNQAVEDELEKIHVLAQKNFKKASKTTAQSFGSSAALDPRRRRVQILIIEASQGASSVSQGTTTSAVQESSPVPPAPAPALSTTSTATDSPTATVATPPKTFQDVTRAR